jgi:hypothetical protein
MTRSLRPPLFAVQPMRCDQVPQKSTNTDFTEQKIGRLISDCADGEKIGNYIWVSNLSFGQILDFGTYLALQQSWHGY